MTPDEARLGMAEALASYAATLNDHDLERDYVTVEEARQTRLRGDGPDHALQAAARLLAYAATARAARDPMGARRCLVLAYAATDEAIH